MVPVRGPGRVSFSVFSFANTLWSVNGREVECDMNCTLPVQCQGLRSTCCSPFFSLSAFVFLSLPFPFYVSLFPVVCLFELLFPSFSFSLEQSNEEEDSWTRERKIRPPLVQLDTLLPHDILRLLLSPCSNYILLVYAYVCLYLLMPASLAGHLCLYPCRLSVVSLRVPLCLVYRSVSFPSSVSGRKTIQTNANGVGEKTARKKSSQNINVIRVPRECKRTVQEGPLSNRGSCCATNGERNKRQTYMSRRYNASQSLVPHSPEAWFRVQNLTRRDYQPEAIFLF